MKKYCLAIALVALLALVGCAEHEHSWNSGVVTKDATCTEKGEMTYTCLVCEATRTEEIDAIGHKWDDGAVTTNPSCTDAGVKTFTCTVCKETKTEGIPATGHTLKDDDWTFDPESFTYVQDCEVCKKQQHKEVESGVRVQGINGFENTLYNSPNDAYAAINEFLGKAENGGLDQNSLNEKTFKSIFTDVDENGDAQVIWTIYGEQEMIEDSEHQYFMTFGRKAAHYGNNLHLSRIVIVGGNESAKLQRSTLTIPYEWWKGCTDKANITFKSISMEGVANAEGKNLVGLTQGNTFGVIMNYEDCDIKGFLYCYINNEYELNVKDCRFDAVRGSEYSIHIQGSATAPAKVKIENCTFSNSRGVNIDQATADAKISGCTFTNCGNLTGETENNYYGALQITKGSTILVEGNTFNGCKGNAIQMWSDEKGGAFSGSLTIKGNRIENCDYAFACYNQKDFTFASEGNVVVGTDAENCFARLYTLNAENDKYEKSYKVIPSDRKLQ